MKIINVGYAYTVMGDIDINLDDFISYCKHEKLPIDHESLKEFVLERVDLLELATDGDLKWLEEMPLGIDTDELNG